jgi:hypothetical protein
MGSLRRYDGSVAPWRCDGTLADDAALEAALAELRDALRARPITLNRWQRRRVRRDLYADVRVVHADDLADDLDELADDFDAALAVLVASWALYPDGFELIFTITHYDAMLLHLLSRSLVVSELRPPNDDQSRVASPASPAELAHMNLGALAPPRDLSPTLTAG